LSYKKSENVKILDSEILLDGFFHVEKLSLKHKLISGEWSPRIDRFVLSRPDAVCAIVHNTVRDIVYLVRQFRPGAFEKDQGWLYELAAGLVDRDEKPIDALHREIEEELGFRFKKVSLIDHFFPSPGIISERVFLYYIEVTDADRVSVGGGLDVEHEDLEIVEIAVEDLDVFMKENPIVDAKTLIGILRFKEIWRQNQISDG
jgi:nudix-type nucleoside diphosphatase (YffH/AdpP family)